MKKKAKIVGVHLVPEWLQDNKYLIRGYRVDHHRKRDLFKSLFSVHNETVNIWTHLLGSLTFIGISVYILFFSELPGKIFLEFMEKFKKINFAELVKSSLDLDIHPILQSLQYLKKKIIFFRKLVLQGDTQKLYQKSVYFQKNNQTLIATTKKLIETQ